MPKKATILHLISLFLVVLTLIGAITAKTSLTSNAESKPATAAKAKKENNPSGFTIEAVSFEAIVSFVHFDLSQEFYFIFTPTFCKLLIFKQYSFTEPLFIISYFANTFCHHIAINAP